MALQIAEHPSRERLVGLLMLALYRCRRQTDALEVYTRGRLRLDEELGLEPSPQLQRLQESILRHDPSLREPSSTGTPRTPVAREAVPPAPATRLIGRERERQEVLDLICADDARLVSLVGPGGVGKTRLALELAAAAMPRFRDGAAWVELAAVGRVEHVPSTVARALAVTPLAGEKPEQALLRLLEAKELLLVIDNFEHVLEAAPLVAGLLAHCRTLMVLATSREALDLSAGHVHPVAPLALPAARRPGRARVSRGGGSAAQRRRPLVSHVADQLGGVQRDRPRQLRRRRGAARRGAAAHPDLMVKLDRQFFDTARARLGDTGWSDAARAGHVLAFRDAIELALAAPELGRVD